MRFIFAILLMMVLPISALALTVDEAVELAISNSNELKRQKEILLARGYESDNTILVFFPQVGAQISYANIWNGFRGAETQGLTLGLNPFSNTAVQQTTATATAGLNIFNGFYDYSLLGLTSANYRSQDYQVSVAFNDAILNTRNAFIGTIKAGKDVQTAKENVTLLDAQRNQALISYQNGLLAKKDILQFDLYLSQAKLQLITAEGMFRTTKLQLENYIGTKLDDAETLVEPVLFNTKLYDFETFKTKILSKNSALKALEEGYNASDKQVTMKRQTLYPKIDASVQYQKYIGDLTNVMTGQITPFGRDSSFTVGVSASWNLVVAASAIYLAQAQKKQTMAIAYSIADTKNNLLLDLQSSIDNYYTSSAGLDQATKNVAFAEENYKTVKLLFDQAAATTTDLLDASVLLNKAKVEKTNASFGVISSIYKLERLIEEKLPVSTEPLKEEVVNDYSISNQPTDNSTR